MKKTNILTLMLMLTVSVAFGQSPGWTPSYSLNYPKIKVGNLSTGEHQMNGLFYFLNGINVPLRSLSDSTDNAASTKFVKQLVQGLGSPLTFNNGLTKTGNNVTLGGEYNTRVEIGGFTIPTLFLDASNNTALLSNPLTAGGFFSYNNSTFIRYSNTIFSMADDGVTLTDELGKGIAYAGNYASGFTNRSLVDKAYVDLAVAGAGSGTYELLANKSTTLTSPNNTTYPTTLAVTNALSGKLSGTGTINYIPKFTATGIIGNSNLIDDGNVVMSSKNLAVSNSLFPQIALINDSKEWDIYVRNADKSFIFSENGIADRILIKTNGNVGFGVDNPLEKVDVNGSIKSSNLSGTGDRPVFASADGVLKIGTTQTPVFQTSGTSATLVSSGRYIPQNASLTIFTLPTTAAVGDVIFINGKGAGGWRIAQNTGQIIHGATDTTTGSAGYVGSTARYNSIAIVCVTANTEWIIQSSQGSLTIN